MKDDIPERRFMIRYPSSGGALVLRDTDKMRSGIDALLKDVSTSGLGIQMQTPLDVGEQVKVRTRNDIQRFEKEVRGAVKHCTAAGDGVFYIGIELLARLTPLEVSLLKMSIAAHAEDGKPKWM